MQAESCEENNVFAFSQDEWLLIRQYSAIVFLCIIEKSYLYLQLVLFV